MSQVANKLHFPGQTTASKTLVKVFQRHTGGPHRINAVGEKSSQPCRGTFCFRRRATGDHSPPFHSPKLDRCSPLSSHHARDIRSFEDVACCNPYPPTCQRLNMQPCPLSTLPRHHTIFPGYPRAEMPAPPLEPLTTLAASCIFRACEACQCQCQCQCPSWLLALCHSADR